MGRGRPKKTTCKRGHDTPDGSAKCIPCRRLRERLKYETNKDYREGKKLQTRTYKRKFRDENGFWQAELYRHKT